jgi:hypothetical protein
VPNHYPGNFLFAQDSDLAPFFGELRKIEKLARIKPTLTLNWMMDLSFLQS